MEWAQQQQMNAIGTQYTQNSLAHKHFAITLKVTEYRTKFGFALTYAFTWHFFVDINCRKEFFSHLLHRSVT